MVFVGTLSGTLGTVSGTDRNGFRYRPEWFPVQTGMVSVHRNEYHSFRGPIRNNWSCLFDNHYQVPHRNVPPHHSHLPSTSHPIRHLNVPERSGIPVFIPVVPTFAFHTTTTTTTTRCRPLPPSRHSRHFHLSHSHSCHPSHQFQSRTYHCRYPRHPSHYHDRPNVDCRLMVKKNRLERMMYDS